MIFDKPGNTWKRGSRRGKNNKEDYVPSFDLFMAFCLAGRDAEEGRQKKVALKGRAGDNQARAGDRIAPRGPRKVPFLALNLVNQRSGFPDGARNPSSSHPMKTEGLW
jgi:hypothetical protein